MGFPFAPGVRDLQRDYVRFVLSRARISRNSSDYPFSFRSFFSLLDKHSHRRDSSRLISTRLSRLLLETRVDKVYNLVLFSTLCSSFLFRSEEKGRGKFLNTHGVIYYEKDRIEKLLSYSLTLHCDLLSGSREPPARPAGEGPRTIRT